jgi:hypothetical protein
MSITTRAQIKQQVKALLQQFFGSVADNDPITMDNLLTMVTDDLCRGTDCNFMSVTADLVSGEESYCAPQLYRITGATIKDVGGNIHNLKPNVNTGMDRRYAANWRANPTQGTPCQYITEGDNRVLLYPIPNYDYTAGIFFEGFGAPGEAWAAESDTCPVPDRAVMAVVYALAVAMAEVDDNVSARKLGLFTARAKAQRGKLERETATLTDAMSHADVRSRYSVWASSY